VARCLTTKDESDLKTNILKSFILVSLRNLKNNKGASYLNLVGLTIGMAACQFIFNYIIYENTYDQAVDDQIYRLESHAFENEELTHSNAFTSLNIGAGLSKRSNKVVDILRVKPYSNTNASFFDYLTFIIRNQLLQSSFL